MKKNVFEWKKQNNLQVSQLQLLIIHRAEKSQ